MKKYFLLLSFFALILSLYSCSNTDCSSFDIDSYYLQEEGNYRLTLSGNTGNALAEILLTVKNREKANISGTYLVSKFYVDTIPGFSSLKGVFSAKESETDNRVIMNMNPSIADNNIFIEFALDKNNISGVWYTGGMLGKTSQGSVKGYKVLYLKK